MPLSTRILTSLSSKTGVSISTAPWRLKTLRIAVNACSRTHI